MTTADFTERAVMAFGSRRSGSRAALENVADFTAARIEFAAIQEEVLFQVLFISLQNMEVAIILNQKYNI